MDRAAWLRQRREEVRADYDRDAAGYDDHPYPTTSHGAFIDRLIATTPPGGIVFDAPCGTGQYFERIRAAGRHVVGIDQSAGMLEVAAARGLADRVEQIGLQELGLESAFDRAFDGAMTVDAMEHIPPEDWPLVLSNLARAVVPGGHLYLTVEETDDATLDAAYEHAIAQGWPAVRGEVIEGDTGGYHAYPSRDRIRAWLAGQGLSIVDEATDVEEGYGYWHLLLRTPVP
jgi:SAM-dependent methyltransferase